jgi:hypothetical protein
MAIQLCIFDQYGKIRSDLASEEETIASLADDVRGKLFACVSAVNAKTDVEDRVITARTDVRLKDVAYNDAVAKDNKANPPATFKSELERTIAANAGRAPEPVKINKKSKAHLATTNQELADARSELSRATAELRVLEAKAAEATIAWMGCLTTPSDQEIRRQYINAAADERLRRVKAGLPAEIPRPVPEHEWPIEKVFAARGKVSANRLPVYRGK